MARIKKESLVDQVYQRLREDIITLKLPLGTRINVNELQARLGVSCTPVREAVNRLQQEGLVSYENNVGASVLLLDEHDVREITQLAYTLQQAAVDLSMEHGDREEMARDIREQIQRYETARTPRETVRAVYELIGTFYHHCGNRRLDESMIALQGQVLLLRNIYATCPGAREDGDLFRQMLSGVEQGDPQMICRALRDYGERCSGPILDWLRSNGYIQ